MSSFPCLARFLSGSGQVRYRLGDRLVDRYLEFVAGRCRPNTLRAVAFDLKAFFTVIEKDPLEVAAADVFEFLADQRGTGRWCGWRAGSLGCRRGPRPAGRPSPSRPAPTPSPPPTPVPDDLRAAQPRSALPARVRTSLIKVG